jgi:uncharacterized protein YndB with AHSA1/START domain
MSSTPNTDVHVTHYFMAPPERVFDAFLDPEMISKWMFGPTLRDEEVLHVALDDRIGGSFSFVVRRQEEEIDHVGSYIEIDRPWSLVFTWAIGHETTDSDRVMVNISPLKTGSELRLIHSLNPQFVDYARRIEDAWTKMFETLDGLLTADLQNNIE